MHQSDLQPLPVPSRPAPHHLPQQQPHAPRGHVAQAARDPEQEEAGLHGAGGTARGLRGLRDPAPSRDTAGGGAASGTGSGWEAGPPETPSPRRAGLRGVGPAWGGGQEELRPGGSAATRGPAPRPTRGRPTDGPELGRCQRPLAPTAHRLPVPFLASRPVCYDALWAFPQRCFQSFFGIEKIQWQIMELHLF